MSLADQLAGAVTGFSGVISVSRGADIEFERAYGLADRAHGVPAAVETQFAVASAVKGFTAVTVAALVADRVLTLATSARSLLGRDLPLVPDEVTVEHLLAHTSGIGDYVDEESGHGVDEYVLNVPVHTLGDTEGYLAALDGFPPKYPVGARFAYCNAGFVLLALMAERAADMAFHDLVEDRVCRPAGMTRTAFLRSDELPGGAAIGYLADGRTNVLHLPVRGSGDGGAYSTVADFRAFWKALFAGRLVALDQVAELVRPRSDVPSEDRRYGLGFWLDRTGPQVILEGYDAGVSFRSVHDPTTATTYTVVSNTSDGAWPVCRRLAELVG